ncbi:hypothetical protein GOC57_11635 [Sinorhizobium meliloti]|nr:hypothetical protein [Sinorhizobium meliloti]MDW9859454.1 hypothetical protein [Sinorhizobium meliloti]MDW9964575.1 hypothetical protein [Sinorhizobium meliloti]MDX0336827.1 hypothetical protein [Sinorhizobium meliloti]
MLDLEACLDYAGAGQNRKAALFEAAETNRIAVTADVFRQLKALDGNLAKEFKNSAIEIIECDEKVFQATENLALLLAVTAAKLDSAATEKLQLLAVVTCAQNGSLPKCVLVTGDPGAHRSSMKVLCEALKITALSVEAAF